MLIKSQISLDQVVVPPCHHVDKMLLLADRHTRASLAMEPWATSAKECVEFVEGKQWSEKEIAILRREKRPAFKWNRIRPLVRLVLGYHMNNRTSSKYLPGWDGTGTDEVAKALTQLDRQIAEINQEPYVDTEVFLDGMTSGRGFYDYRLGFEQNELGETSAVSKDQFSVLLDPDAEDYDLNKGSFVIEDRWANLDEIEFVYGKSAAALVSPLVGASGFSGVPYSIVDYAQTIAPWRTFGGTRGVEGFQAMESYFFQSYDPSRKNIRIIDCQHYVRVMQRCFLDLETGIKEPIEDDWDEARIQKALQWAEEKYRMRGQASPVRVVTRPMRRARWTTAVGDIIVWDKWSPYSSFSIIGYFPWFRRGKTQGMVDDLIDPQREINKRGSVEIDIVTRTAHSGWTYHEQGLREEEQIKLEKYGATPGINIKWKGESWMEPKRIQPAAPPMAMERLQQKNVDALKEISSINDGALGELDIVQSGRALEARQRQAVVGIQIYLTNMSRTKELTSRKKLELIQDHYVEERLYRIRGDDGKQALITINKRLAAGEIANDVTNGSYSLDVDETPLSKSYLSAQTEELMEMVKAGIIPIPIIQDIAVDMSSIPQKDTVKKRLQQFAAAQGMPMGDEAGTIVAPAQELAQRAGSVVNQGGAPVLSLVEGAKP